MTIKIIAFHDMVYSKLYVLYVCGLSSASFHNVVHALSTLNQMPDEIGILAELLEIGMSKTRMARENPCHLSSIRPYLSSQGMALQYVVTHVVSHFARISRRR